MFCSQCGTQLPNGTQFCTQCGNPVAAPKPVAPAKKRKGKGLLIFGLCAGLVLALGIAVAALFLFPGKETVYLLTRRVSYDNNGNVTGQLVFDYDSQGRLVCAQLQNAAGETHRQFQMAYDEYSNRTLEAIELSSDGSDLLLTHETSYDFSYNKDGRVEECEFSTGKGAPETTCEFTYDENGNLILVEWECENTYSSGPLWQYYEYDEKGNLTAEYFCNLFYYGYTPDTAASQVNRITYEYTKDGHLMEVATASTQSDKKLDWRDLSDLDFKTSQRWDFEYDKEGRMCAVNGESLEYDKQGNLDAEGFIFDEKGNLIREESSNGSCKEYTYEALTLSRADARVAQRQKSCLPSEFISVTYVFSLDPIKSYMYPFIFKSNLFYSYMIPLPIW